MHEPTSGRTDVRNREERWLERLQKRSRSAKDLAARVASSSESAAALFRSEYNPESERGEDPRETPP